MSDTQDVELWYETNPSLGTVLSERTIRSELGDDRLDDNIQRLGLWLSYNQKSAIAGKITAVMVFVYITIMEIISILENYAEINPEASGWISRLIKNAKGEK